MATPMNTYLQLSADLIERRQTLHRIRDFKIDATIGFLNAKCRGLDPDRPYYFLDRHMQNGDAHTFMLVAEKFANISLEDAFEVVQSFSSRPPKLPNALAIQVRSSSIVVPLLAFSMPCEDSPVLTD